MKLRRPILILVSLLGAYGITAIAYRADQVRYQTHQSEELFRWAKQVAIEAEGLATHARSQGNPDPAGWAIGFLGQAVEPRIMKVSKLRKLDTSGDNEYANLDLSRLQYEFGKVATPENGEGFLVRIYLSYRGFLDARSKLGNDVTFAGFLAMCFFGFWGGLGFFFKSRQKGSEAEALPEGHEPAVSIQPQFSSPEFRERLLKGRENLTQLGAEFREIVRGTHHLTTAAVKSRDAVRGMRDGLHKRIGAIHANRAELKEGRQLFNEAEALLRQITPKAGLAKRDVLALTALVQRMSEAHQRTEAVVRDLEVGLEPMATDADLAFHSYSDLFQVTARMNQHITQTKETLIAQARLTQEMTQELPKVPKASKTEESESTEPSGQLVA